MQRNLELTRIRTICDYCGGASMHGVMYENNKMVYKFCESCYSESVSKDISLELKQIILKKAPR